MSTALLVLHAFGASCMAGIGWFVQTVHYPLFGYADAQRWTDFHAQHSRRTAWVVSVPWAIQGFSALALLVARPEGVSMPLIVVAVVLAGVTVVSTVALALPAHARLADGRDDDVIAQLVRRNWVRTIAWTAAAAVAAAMIVQYIDAK